MDDVTPPGMMSEWSPSAFNHFSRDTSSELASRFSPTNGDWTVFVAKSEQWMNSSDDEIIQGSRARTPSPTDIVEDDIPFDPYPPVQSKDILSKFQKQPDKKLISSSDQMSIMAPTSDFTSINQPPLTNSSHDHVRYEESVRGQASKKRQPGRSRKAMDTPKKLGKRCGGRTPTEPDPVTGRSKTKTAVDHFQRKEIEREYKRKVAAFIDDDILHQVELEGGITPDGRFYKAATLMFERVKKEPQSTQRPLEVDDTKRVKELEVANQLLNAKLRRARNVLAFDHDTSQTSRADSQNEQVQ